MCAGKPLTARSPFGTLRRMGRRALGEFAPSGTSRRWAVGAPGSSLCPANPHTRGEFLRSRNRVSERRFNSPKGAALLALDRTMPFPIDVTRCLAYAPADTDLEVCSIPSDALRARLAIRGVFEHDEITCRRDPSGHVLVTTADGATVLVETSCAVMIEVAPTLSVGARSGARQPRESVLTAEALR